MLKDLRLFDYRCTENTENTENKRRTVISAD